jgi:hypothetical protein
MPVISTTGKKTTFVHWGAESIQRRKVFKGGNYMRKYGINIFLHRIP